MEGSGGKDEFVFCGACGARLDAGVRFCTSCGASQAPFDVGERPADEGGAPDGAGDDDAPPAPTGGQAGGDDAPADAPTEAMPAGSPPQPAAVGQEPPSPPPSAPAGAFAALQGAGGQGPPPPPPASPATPGAQPGGQRGFFESLLDTKFENLITPKLIRFFYVLSMIVLAIGTIATIAAAASVDDASGILFLFVAPLTALAYLIVIRLWLELIVVAFKIRDAVEQVADNTRRSDV